jgi:hypothetical protein
MQIKYDEKNRCFSFPTTDPDYSIDIEEFIDGRRLLALIFHLLDKRGVSWPMVIELLKKAAGILLG